MSQNCPNPFSHSTVIGYHLPVSGKVVLKVFDMQGQEIQTLVNNNQPAGKHSVVWDGKNNSGNIVEPGVYFYHMKAGNDFSGTKKMLLLK